MNNKVFVILGKFASGKTTIAKMLEQKYNMKRVVTCTTRNKREGERNGIDYYFYTDEEFEELATNNKLVAINRVPVIEQTKPSAIKLLVDKTVGKVSKKSKPKYSKKYGIPVEKIDLSSGSYVCVLEPSGYFDLIDKLGRENVIGIYLKLSDKERWLRALNREINPDVDDIVKKHVEERFLYEGIEKRCNKVVENMGTSDSAAIEIYEYIKKTT